LQVRYRLTKRKLHLRSKRREMSLEIYSKDPPISYNSEIKSRDRYFFALISIIGLGAVLFATWPFFVWQMSTLPRLSGGFDDAPIPQARVLSAKSPNLENIQVVQDADGFSYFIPTNLSENDPNDENRSKEFSVSIPKLNINNAIAKVDSLDFRKNLSHFPGTALPGEVGNSFITGHSVLPQFSDPENYNAIFTKLSDLEIGDKVNVARDGKQYQYIVQYSKVVNPKDLSVLAPISENAKNLTLMTCVPPGTNIKRLVVITSLI